MKNFTLIACAVLSPLPAAVIAGPATPSPADGATIAASGVPGTAAAACVTCHGAKGEGNAATGFPRLAGQSAAYLQRQLAAYSDGHRANEVMSPIAKALSASARQAVAEYFATLPPTQSDMKSASPAQRSTSRGEVLALRGDEALKVQACANCHGPGGMGEAPLVPALAAQHASYLKAAVKAWKDGSRNTDASGQMPAIARALPDSDVLALATYYAGLPLPDRSQSPQHAPPLAKRGSSIPSGPRSATKPPAGDGSQGIGTEQGSPTGGAQGPGGGGGAQQSR